MPLGGSTEQLGSHKGYGYGMFCEIFCSILSQGLTSNHTHIDEMCIRDRYIYTRLFFFLLN